MPTSEKQLAANRRNARQSTGPITPEGKAAVRHNALRQGILARETVITRDHFQEDATEFETLLAELCADRYPHGALEALAVQEIAVSYWRLRAETTESGRNLAEQAEPVRPWTITGRSSPSTHPPCHLPPPSLPSCPTSRRSIPGSPAR